MLDQLDQKPHHLQPTGQRRTVSAHHHTASLYHHHHHHHHQQQQHQQQRHQEHVSLQQHLYQQQLLQYEHHLRERGLPLATAAAAAAAELLASMSPHQRTLNLHAPLTSKMSHHHHHHHHQHHHHVSGATSSAAAAAAAAAATAAMSPLNRLQNMQPFDFRKLGATANTTGVASSYHHSNSSNNSNQQQLAAVAAHRRRAATAVATADHQAAKAAAAAAAAAAAELGLPAMCLAQGPQAQQPATSLSHPAVAMAAAVSANSLAACVSANSLAAAVSANSFAAASLVASSFPAIMPLAAAAAAASSHSPDMLTAMGTSDFGSDDDLPLSDDDSSSGALNLSARDEHRRLARRQRQQLNQAATTSPSSRNVVLPQHSPVSLLPPHSTTTTPASSITTVTTPSTPHSHKRSAHWGAGATLPLNLGTQFINPATGKKRVQCNVCLKTFCDKGALKIHFSAVHLREMHKCTVEGCNMMFSSRRSRNRHSANPNPKLHSPHLRRKISPHDGRSAQAHQLLVPPVAAAAAVACAGLAGLSGALAPLGPFAGFPLLAAQHAQQPVTLGRSRCDSLTATTPHAPTIGAAPLASPVNLATTAKRRYTTDEEDDDEGGEGIVVVASDDGDYVTAPADEYAQKRVKFSSSDLDLDVFENEDATTTTRDADSNEDSLSVTDIHSLKDEQMLIVPITGKRKRKSQNPTKCALPVGCATSDCESSSDGELYAAAVAAAAAVASAAEETRYDVDEEDDDYDEQPEDLCMTRVQLNDEQPIDLGGAASRRASGTDQDDEDALKRLESMSRGNSASPCGSDDGSENQLSGIGMDPVPLDRENPRRCTACGKLFQNHFGVKTHYQNVHLKLMHKCNVDGCNAAFPSKRSRDRHSANLNLHRKLLSTASPTAASDFLARLYAAADQQHQQMNGQLLAPPPLNFSLAHLSGRAQPAAAAAADSSTGVGSAHSIEDEPPTTSEHQMSPPPQTVATLTATS